MTFTEAVKTCVRRKYANFRDRAPRSELWWFVLFLILASMVAGILDRMIFGIAPTTELDVGDGGFDASVETNGPIAAIFSLAMFIPNLAVGARRLHDIGRSGWWLLIALIPLVGALVLLWWYTRPSEEGPNKWGPNPQDPAGTIAHDGASYARSRVPTVDREER